MGTGDDEPTTKVGRLLAEYELDGLGAELEAHWTADTPERKSLRDLAALFNRELLRTQMRKHEMSTVDRDVARYYRLLTDDEVTTGQAVEARNELTEHGIDIDDLTGDFVTYQAVRGYLRNVRGAEYDRSGGDSQIEVERDRIERLITRTEAVTRDKLDQLENTDRIDLGTPRLFVGIDVFCEDCGSRYAVGQLLDRGGCDCDE